MRKYILFITLVVTLASCNRDKKHLGAVAITWLADLTDTNRIYPNAKSLIALYHFPDNRCREAYFCKTFITDMDNVNEEEYHLDNRILSNKQNRFDDPKHRERVILKFMNDVNASILTSTNMSYSAELSETKCFHAVCRALERLVDLDAQRKYLIISSDMIENSKNLRGYSDDTYNKVMNEDDAVKYLEGKLKDCGDLPKSLNGITVYILHLPKNREEDQLFTAFGTAYQNLLEKRGATVHIKSNNQIKEYSNEK